MDVHGAAMQDDGNLLNALLRGPSIPAIASFRVQWDHPAQRVSVRDEENMFVGKYSHTSASIEWSASNDDGFSFVSNEAETSSTVFAEVGHERNGFFFS